MNSWVLLYSVVPFTASILHPILLLNMASLSKEAKHRLWEKLLITRKLGLTEEKQLVQGTMASTPTNPIRDFRVPNPTLALATWSA